MAKLSFIKKFHNTAAKMVNVSDSSAPPRYWYSSGNYVLNYISSGNFNHAIPQGRITALAGPSGSGKSFVSCNIAREAQANDTFVLMIDSESALDDSFTTKIGINVDTDYDYKSVVTIDDTVALLSAFVGGYKDAYGSDENAPKVLIIIDSLDMMLTSTEFNNMNSGEIKGDQGQRAKQIKAFLRNMVQQIKHLNIAMVVTTHVYAANRDAILSGQSDGLWVINSAVKFSLSHLILLTKLKLKDGKEITGIKMKCQPVKTRFTKPFQDVVVEVPYDTGMDPYSGLADVAKAVGVLEKKGSYVVIAGTDTQFYAKDIKQYADEIFARIEDLGNISLEMTEELGLEEEVEKQASNKSKRSSKMDKLKEELE